VFLFIPFLIKKVKEAYLNPFVDGQLYEADGGVVGHGVQVVLSPPVHARRYEPAARGYLEISSIFADQ